MAKIKVIPDDSIEALLPEKTFIRVAATANDGTSYSVEVMNPLGHPDNPMEDPHIEKKFLTLAEPVIGKERGRVALGSWWCVDDAADVSRLLKLLDLKSATTNSF
jgi:2-methylcitrate dehydratase PrpD